LENPVLTTDVNVQGTVQIFLAAKEAGVKRVVYASSSSVYGDEPTLPKVEGRLGKLLSPYAASKMTNELYAQVFTKAYGMEMVGLRYFNVFGRRQSPDGPYAAVIPKWVEALLKFKPVTIYGDGKTSRDFCYVDNAVQANLLAAQTQEAKAFGDVFNIAVDHTTSLNDLFQSLKTKLSAHDARIAKTEVHYAPFRAGDILHSRADIQKARTLLGYAPRYSLEQGLDEALVWYRTNA
jgi:UDP-N-acetylglucosamine 4-epimerase